MTLNLDKIRRRYERAQQLLTRKGDHPAARTRGAINSAEDVPALLAEVERTKHHDMYESAYFGVQSVLDEALGGDEEDGAGAGIVADVALLAQRYADLRKAVLNDGDFHVEWPQRVAEIEAADLRENAETPA